jgi:hypothetical protein
MKYELFKRMGTQIYNYTTAITITLQHLIYFRETHDQQTSN